MRKAFSWFFIVGLVFTQQAFGFNLDKCSKITVSAIGSLISTLGYVSSSGDCSAMGEVNKFKKEFIAVNLDKIKMDSAKGNGEYLLAYSKLADCSSKDGAAFMASTQKEYQSIYNFNDPKSIYSKLEAQVNKACR